MPNSKLPPTIELLDQAARPSVRMEPIRVGQAYHSQRALAQVQGRLALLDALDPNPYRPRGTPARSHSARHQRGYEGNGRLRRARDLNT